MKRSISLALACILLCGCSELKKIDNSTEINNDLIYDDAEDEYIARFAYTGGDNEFVPEEKKAELSKFTLIDASLIQENMPNENVEVYKNKFSDILLATDGTNYEIYNGNVGIPSSYSDYIYDIMSEGWHFMSSVTGAQLSRLDFGNSEYVLANNDFSFFSIKYDNVSLVSDNVPIGVSLYNEGNNVKKIYIKYYKLKENIELSDTDRAMLSYILQKASLKDVTSALNIIETLIHEGTSPQVTDEYTIKTLAPSPHSNNLGAIIFTPS